MYLFRDSTVLDSIPYARSFEPGEIKMVFYSECKAFSTPSGDYVKEMFNDTIYRITKENTLAARWMVDYVAETGFDASLPIGFIHSDNPEGAVEVRSMLAEKATWGEEMTQGIGPVIGTHIGDGCVAIACFWKEK